MTRSVIIYTLHQILLGKLIRGVNRAIEVPSPAEAKEFSL
jgi:hypothetical protein